MRAPFGLSLLLLAALAGCGRSPRTRTLTLDAAAPPPGRVRADYRGPPIAVPAVHLPAAIDRAEFARETGAGEVKVDDFARWAASPGLLARDALVRDLTARLPEGAVLPPGTPAGAARLLDVTILSLDPGPGTPTMQAAYRWLPGGAVRQVRLTLPSTAAADPAAAARAASALLGALADRIAADLPSAATTR